MAYRFIYSIAVILQYTIFDIMQKGIQALEEVDLRTQGGLRRYKQIYGSSPRMNGARPRPEEKDCDPPPSPSPEMEYVLGELPERGQRLVSGYLALTAGKGGVQEAARQTGLDAKTVRRGKQEIEARAELPKGRSRQAGGGRDPKAKADPTYRREMEEIVDQNTGGDPMGRKPNFVRKGLRWMQAKLREVGTNASLSTIRATLKDCFHVSLKKNRKGDSGPRHPDREAQFQYIFAAIAWFRATGNPIISIDGKKKELIGNFENKGETWRKDPIVVSEHDFLSAAEGKIVPFGIYDLQHNAGHVYCSLSAETPEFAADTVTAWWQDYGRADFPGKRDVLVLCDSGGASGCRPWLWKVFLQQKLADDHGLTVWVCHYPKGASKYNPIERRLFSFISMNWAGEPLSSVDKVLAFIRSTTTAAGLAVTAARVDKVYQKGLRASKADIKGLNIARGPVCPRWNYVIRPHPPASPPS